MDSTKLGNTTNPTHPETAMSVTTIKPIFDFDEYQRLALRTMADSQMDPTLQSAGLALGLVGEAGEYADAIKKWILQGHERPDGEELGDVLWYIAALAEDSGWDLSAIAGNNIAKLEARYPGGAFSTERSRER